MKWNNNRKKIKTNDHLDIPDLTDIFDKTDYGFINIYETIAEIHIDITTNWVDSTLSCGIYLLNSNYIQRIFAFEATKPNKMEWYDSDKYVKWCTTENTSSLVNASPFREGNWLTAFSRCAINLFEDKYKDSSDYIYFYEHLEKYRNNGRP